MSRQALPFSKSVANPTMKKQICVYGYTREALALFTKHQKTCNEKYEDIELLRFIDLGHKIKMTQTTVSSIAVDVPKDIKKVEDYLNSLQ